MSAEAQPEVRLPAVDGNTVRPLDAGGACEASSRPLKKPALKALPKIRRQHRGLVSGVIALVVLALVAVLAVNIHVSNNQYQVVQLQYQHQDLLQNNQALTQQVQHLESPQALSNSAVSLGMVMPSQAAAFDLATGEVSGEAVPADTSDRPSNFVATPIQPGEELAEPLNVSEHVTGAPGGLLGTGALETLSQPAPGQNEEAEAQESTSEDSRPDFDRERLNGGTVPAPSLD